MTISELSQYTQISPNTSGLRTAPISKITVHHMAGDLDIWTCANVFAPTSRQASSNYGVDSAGRIACYLPEEYHPWTSASYWNDDRAVTIEVADYDCYNWVPSDAAYEATVRLCADICSRYGIEPSYDGSIYASFTEHQMFASTNCPGPWWHAKMPQFVEDVKAVMRGEDMAGITVDEMKQMAQMNWEYIYRQGLPGEDKILGEKSWSNRYNVLNSTYLNAKSAAEKIEEIEKKIEEIEKHITEIGKKVESISAGNVDYALLASAVADELSKRMKE